MIITQKIENLKVLMIEDSPTDARLISEYIKLSKLVEIELIDADRVSTGLKKISNDNFDVLLLDLSLPDANRLEALEKITAFTKDLPIIVLTGLKDEEIAISAVKKGAQDYLVKGNFTKDSLIRSIIYAVERNKAQKELKKQKMLLESAINALNNPFYIIDVQNYRIEHSNSATRQVYGELDEKITCFNLLHKHSKPCSNSGRQCSINRVKEAKTSFVEENVYINKDDNSRIFEFHIHPIFDDDGEVVQVIEYSLDITDRKTTEAALTQSEEQYRSLFEGNPIGLYRTTPEGNFVAANRVFLDMMGYSSLSDLSELNSDRLSSDLGYPRQQFQESLEKDGEISGFESQIKRHDGSIIFFRENAKAVKDIDGSILYYEGSVEDITEKRQAEEALREANTNYMAIFENAMDGIIISQDQVIRLTNQSYSNISGYSKEELIGKDILDLIAPESKHLIAERYELRMAGEDVPSIYDFKMECKDGSIKEVQGSFGLLKYQKKPAIIGVIRDVTAFKKAKKELIVSEEKFKTLFQTSRDAIAFTSVKGKILDANQATLDMLGFTKEEIITRSTRDFTPKKWVAMEKEIMINQVLKQGYSEVYEKEFIRKDGSIFPIETRVGLMKNEVGKPSQMFGIVRDITSHKKAEETIRHRTRDLGERIKELNCLFGVSTATEDPDRPLEDVFNRILYLIPHAWQYPEITCARIIFEGREYTTEDFRDSKWKQSANIKIGENQVGIIEVFYLEERSGIYEGPFQKEERNMIETIAVAIGKFIERNQTAGILADEQKNFHRILDSMEDGVYIVNAQEEIEFVNSVFKEEFGSLNGKKCFEYFHNRTESCAWCHNEKVLAGKTVRWEWTSYRNRKTYDIISTPVKNPDGSLSKLEIFRDITDRKMMEEKVRENEEKFRGIFTQAFDAILILDKVGRIVDVNTAGCNLLEYEKEQLINLTLRDILSKKEFEKMISIIKRIIEGYSSHIGEIVFFTKNGNRITAEGGGATIEIAGERFIVASFRDITERIRWEEEMKNRLMKFNIEDGNVYLVKENTPILSLNVFNDLITVGYRGHLVSRTPKKDLNTSENQKFDYFWVAEKSNEKTALFDAIEELIDDKSRRNTILIDRLDYFISNYGFQETIQFIYRIREIAYLRNLVGLLSLDPTILNEKETNLLEKETLEITPRFMAKIPEEFLEILRYVYKMNNLGAKPSYTEVRDELDISRPTVSKRIKQMLATGYLHEYTKGNRKILELSQKGRTLFMF